MRYVCAFNTGLLYYKKGITCSITFAVSSFYITVRVYQILLEIQYIGDAVTSNAGKKLGVNATVKRFNPYFG